MKILSNHLLNKKWWVLVIYANSTNTQLCKMAYKSCLRTPTVWGVMFTNTYEHPICMSHSGKKPSESMKKWPPSIRTPKISLIIHTNVLTCHYEHPQNSITYILTRICTIPKKLFSRNFLLKVIKILPNVPIYTYEHPKGPY